MHELCMQIRYIPWLHRFVLLLFFFCFYSIFLMILLLNSIGKKAIITWLFLLHYGKNEEDLIITYVFISFSFLTFCFCFCFIRWLANWCLNVQSSTTMFHRTRKCIRTRYQHFFFKFCSFNIEILKVAILLASVHQVGLRTLEIICKQF